MFEFTEETFQEFEIILNNVANVGIRSTTIDLLAFHRFIDMSDPQINKWPPVTLKGIWYHFLYRKKHGNL